MTGSEALLGRTLDKYRLMNLIGEGGMGSVFLGEHTTIKKKVAVKVLHPHLAQAYPTIAQRMLKEAQAAAMIGHPDIADVLDYGETEDGYHFLVMELLNGKEMSDLIKERGKLGTHLTLAIADHLLSALEAAHSKGIVHRDLKPENIFLHVDRTGLYQIKLLDFGISKFTADNDMRITKTGAVMGTPYYMSLEQAEGATDIDHRTDIYSTGVILYQALSGHLPFSGENPNQVMVAIIRGGYKPLAKLCPHLDPGLIDIISRVMSSDRETRIQSASAFRQALKPHWDPRHPSIQDAFESLGVQPISKGSGILGSGGFSPAPSLSPAPSMPSAPSATPQTSAPQTLGAEKPGQKPQRQKLATAATMAESSSRLKKTKTAKRFPVLPSSPDTSTPKTAPKGDGLLPPPPPAPLSQKDALPAPLPPNPTSQGQKAKSKKKILVIGILVFLGIFILLLVATDGFGGCKEKKAKETKKAVTKKKKKKKRKKRRRRQPRIIRDIRRIF